MTNERAAGAIEPVARLAAIERGFAASLPEARIAVKRWRKGQPKEAWLRQDTGLSVLGIADWRGSPGGHTDFAPLVAPLGDRRWCSSRTCSSSATTRR